MAFAYIVFLDVLEIQDNSLSEFTSLYVNLDNLSWISYSDDVSKDGIQGSYKAYFFNLNLVYPEKVFAVTNEYHINRISEYIKRNLQ